MEWIEMNEYGQWKSYCTCCGAGINNVFTYKGQHYGSECVQIVSGVKVKDVKGNDIDQHLEERAARIAKMEAEAKEYRDKAQVLYDKYSVENKWLIDFLYSISTKEYWIERKRETIQIINEGSFTYQIAEDLERKSIDDLSEKVFNIIIDIWAKHKGGRVGSKKYNEAYDEFLKLAGLYEEEELSDKDAEIKYRKTKQGYKATLMIENGEKIELGYFEKQWCKEADDKALELGWKRFGNRFVKVTQ